MGNFKKIFEAGYCKHADCKDVLIRREGGGFECLGYGAIYGSDGEPLETDGLDEDFGNDDDLVRVVDSALFFVARSNHGIIPQRVWGC